MSSSGNVPAYVLAQPVEPTLNGRGPSVWNVLGQQGFPMLIVPVVLPLSITLTARPYDEKTLYEIASVYEKATHWRVPPPARAASRDGAIPDRVAGMPLTANALLDAARAATGLGDFGDPSFRAGLDALLASLDEDARLNVIGEMAHEAQLSAYLCERLRIEDWYRRHPEIAGERIGGPIFVTGLPRTGTTALSHLLAADPDTRALRMWESQAPTPPPERATYESDARIAAAEARNAVFRDDPDFLRMYDGTATSPTENIDLLGQHFATQHFEGMAHVPGYVRWWLGCDMVPAYRHHERVLKLLQWRCPPTRWFLKSPPDLSCLDAFVAVYPRARIVWTHRDPAKVLASVCKLIFIVRRMQTDHVDLHELGREQLALWSEGIRRALAFRRTSGEERFADVFMQDLVARPIETVAALYDRIGLPFTAAAEAAMRAWSAEHPQHKHGALPYTLAEFGLAEDEVRDAFRDYTQHFALRPGS